MVRVNNQLGFFPVTSPKGKAFLAVFGTWLGLAQVSTGLEHERSCKHTAKSPADGEEKGAQGGEREGEDQRENAQCVSALMAHELSSQQGTDGKGFPHIPQRRLLAMVLHCCSTALCSRSSVACPGAEIPVHTSGTSVDAFSRLGRASLQPIRFVGSKYLPSQMNRGNGFAA